MSLSVCAFVLIYISNGQDMVPLRDTDWEAALALEASAESSRSNPVEGDAEGLGCLPLHPGHPLMMTFIQNQWMQNPTNTTHGMYSPEFFRMHYAAINAQMDPQCHGVNLSEAQVEALGPAAHDQLPQPWTVIKSVNLNQ